MQNFITLGQPLLGEKNVVQKKEGKKKERKTNNTPQNSEHFVPQKLLRAAQALQSDQNCKEI
jgi:hypothetical protein